VIAHLTAPIRFKHQDLGISTEVILRVGHNLLSRGHPATKGAPIFDHFLLLYCDTLFEYGCGSLAEVPRLLELEYFQIQLGHIAMEHDRSFEPFAKLWELLERTPEKVTPLTRIWDIFSERRLA